MNTIVNDFKNAFNRRENYLTKLIIINVIAWLVYMLINVFIGLSSKDLMYTINRFLLLSDEPSLFLTRPWTFVTHFFLHSPSSIFHIIMNMYVMYWFGRIIEDFIGSSKILNIYILGGLAGGIFFVLAYNTFPLFANRAALLVGASGCVTAIVVAAATLVPNYEFSLLFIGRVKIIYIAMFYVVLSLAQSIGANSGGNIAHLGGAFLGFIYIKQLQSGRDLGKPIWYVINTLRRIGQKPQPKVTYRNTKSSSGPKSAFSKTSASSSSTSKVSQEEIDAILDKISVSGYDSLTKEEKQKLFSASNK